MKKCLFASFLAFLLILKLLPGFGQSDFSFNDDDAQVCVEEGIQITNNTSNSNTTDWNLCYGRLTNVPGIEEINNTTLTGPAFTALAFDGNDYFLFVTNHQGNSITRFTLGDDPANEPVNEFEISSPLLPDKIQGIDVLHDQGNWYAFVTGGQNTSSLIRVDFGADLSTNTPAFSDLGFNTELAYPQDMEFVYTDSLWYAFTVNNQDNNLVRFDFDSTLTNSPTPSVISGLSLSQPAGLDLIEESGNFFLFITNMNPASIVRADLGADITNNTPTVSAFSDPLLQSPYGITISKDCRNFVGFTVNRQQDNMVRLDFAAGLNSEPSNYHNLGSLGMLYHSQGISQVLTTKDGNRYLFVTNVDGDSVMRLSFQSCEASYEVSTGNQLTTTDDFEPPQYYYNAPGTYNVQLITDRGLTTESRACKTIQVLGGSLNLGADTTICPLDTLTLNVNPSLQNIQWQGKRANPEYLVTSAGTYYASATNQGCEMSDTIKVDVYPDDLNLGPDTFMTLGTTITLDPGIYNSYTWNTGATSRTLEVDDEGQYILNVTDENNCLLQDTIQVDLRVKDEPNVFTPNGDGINDTWKLDFKHTFPDARVKIYNRYGKLLKQFDVSEEIWDGTVNGELLPPDTYWYVIYYNDVLQPKKGHVTIKY